MVQKWVKVYRAHGLAEAYIVKGLLEASGIECKLKYETIGMLLGISLNGLGEVEILVPEDSKDEASDIILASNLKVVKI